MRNFIFLILAVVFFSTDACADRYFNEDVRLIKDLGIKYIKNVPMKRSEGLVKYDKLSEEIKIAAFRKFSSHREYTHFILCELYDALGTKKHLNWNLDNRPFIKEVVAQRGANFTGKQLSMKVYNEMKTNSIIGQRADYRELSQAEEIEVNRLVKEGFDYQISILQKKGVNLDEVDAFASFMTIMFGVPMKIYSD